MAVRSSILIIGAGEAGRTLLSDYRKMGKEHFIIGFLDDDEKKKGESIDGKEVIGSTDIIGDVITSYSVGQIIIAMPSVKQEVIKRLVAGVMSRFPYLAIHIVPSAEKFFDAVPISPSLRGLSFAELFEREETCIDLNKMNDAYQGRTVLVTGAGGSIGSELCRQLLKFEIRKIVAIGRGEYSIYNLMRSIDEFLDLMDHRPVMVYKIADVKDYHLMKRIISEEKPDIIFHAAAHKHVPLMESNEIEAIQNNVGGTLNLLKLAAHFSIGRFILISTDKAVNPTSIMGATKRIAEILTRFYHQEYKVKAAVVRFGNVIESRGSVIPLFREQIEKGGPVTVTHPEVSRFFMSIPEAALLVLNAAAFSIGGELFMLEMGKQHRVDEIARRLIELYGFKPGIDIKVQYTGLRPGEKLHEEMMFGDEEIKRTSNEKIYIIKKKEPVNSASISIFLEKNLPDIVHYSNEQVKSLIISLIPEYKCPPLSDMDSNN